MVDLRTIWPSNNTWTSALHMALKKDSNSWHSLDDYLRLNAKSTPHTHDLTTALKITSVFFRKSVWLGCIISFPWLLVSHYWWSRHSPSKKRNRGRFGLSRTDCSQVVTYDQLPGKFLSIVHIEIRVSDETSERTTSWEFETPQLGRWHYWAHSTLKKLTSKATVLISISIDASDPAIGEVLLKWANSGWWLLAFFLRRSLGTGPRYSAFARELLNVYCAVEGWELTLLIDHNPLEFTLSPFLAKYSPWESRQVDYVSQHISDTRHISGANNLFR